MLLGILYGLALLITIIVLDKRRQKKELQQIAEQHEKIKKAYND